MQNLGSLSRGRENNFDLIRFLAASTVIIAHAYAISGISSVFMILPNHDIGNSAVIIFFGLSGFFITKSYIHTNSIIEFATARFMRLMPGLAVMLVVTTFLLGTVVSTLPVLRYLTSRETWGYAVHNMFLWHTHYWLPGVFINNPYPRAVNGSIWTLPFEVGCYVAVALLGMAKLLNGWRAVLPAGAYLLYSVAFQHTEYALPQKWEETSFAFFIGSIFFLLRERIPLHPLVLVGAIGATALLWQTKIALEVYTLTLIYAAFVFGSLPVSAFRHFGRFGDFSYGIYIYAFPIEQTVALLWKGVTPLTLAVTTFLGTLPLAIVSWHLVEKRALDQRHSIGRRLTAAAHFMTRSYWVERIA